MSDERAIPTPTMLGHLAVFNALYAGACVVLVGVWAAGGGGAGPRLWGASAYAGLLAMSVYLLDRVKLRDGWLDPADLASHPSRMALLWPRRRAVRAMMVASGLAGVSLGATLGWELVAMAPLAWAGVLVYANRAIVRPRPKDILIVKNAAVAAGHAAMSVVCVWVAGGRRADRSLAVAGGLLGVVVFADAVLCDLPDREGDGAFATQTVPVRFGVRAAWAVGWAVILAGAGGLWAIAGGGWIDRSSGEWAAGLLVVTTAALMLVPVRALRDGVDLRLPVVAAAVVLLTGV